MVQWLMLDNDIVVSEFQLQSRDFILFRTKTLRKGMDLFPNY